MHSMIRQLYGYWSCGRQHFDFVFQSVALLENYTFLLVLFNEQVFTYCSVVSSSWLSDLLKHMLFDKYMNNQELPPIASSRRYGSSIPSGRISQFGATEVPIISRKGTSRSSSLSVHDVIDPAQINQKLKSLSHAGQNQMDTRISLEVEKKEKANLKFLRYKFNPGSKEDQSQNVERKKVDQYGQLGRKNRERISVNVFYEHRNVLFQDQRAPLVYKKLFLEKENTGK